MKVPRNLSAVDLENALRREFCYEITRRMGSHRRLVTQTGGEDHLTIPWHDPLRVGALRAILGQVMEHRGVTLEALLRRLDLA